MSDLTTKGKLLRKGWLCVCGGVFFKLTSAERADCALTTISIMSNVYSFSIASSFAQVRISCYLWFKRPKGIGFLSGRGKVTIVFPSA